jgi:hypothetical protein
MKRQPIHELTQPEIGRMSKVSSSELLFAWERFCPKQFGLKTDQHKDDEWFRTRNAAFPHLGDSSAIPHSPLILAAGV